jgi:hypothetical protein
MFRFHSVVIIIWSLTLSGCRIKPTEHTIPDISVNIDIDINLAQYNDLNFIGGWVYLNGGYNGMIVHRSTVDIIAAYDRQAPYLVSDHCQLDVDSGGVTCKDPCSGSKWILFDGQLVKGPATYPLKQYTTSFDGVRLSITN